MASACPRSSASIPGYAPCVSIKVMTGRLNFSASCIARRVSQLAKGLGLYLSDALARHVEVLADLFERVLLACGAEAVAEFDDDLLARAQGRKHRVRYRAQVRR